MLALQPLPAAQIHGWAARDQCQSHAVWAGGCSVASMCHRCLQQNGAGTPRSLHRARLAPSRTEATCEKHGKHGMPYL